MTEDIKKRAVKIVKNTCNYIDFLHYEHNLFITLHHVENLCFDLWYYLLKYNYHTCSVCREVKNNIEAWNHCIERQEKIKNKASKGSFFGTCYMGVSEFVYPIQDFHNKTVGFLCVSGYVHNKEDALLRIEKACEKYFLSYKKLTQSLDKLQETLPIKSHLDILVAPILDMIAMLMNLYMLEDVYTDKLKAEKNYFKIMNDINYGYRNPEYSLKIVSERLGLSYSYASHLFSKYNEDSFGTCVKKMRIACAKRYLEHTTLRIDDIAFEVGYNDVNYFNRVFKKDTGFTPMQWKEKMEGHF